MRKAISTLALVAILAIAVAIAALIAFSWSGAETAGKTPKPTRSIVIDGSSTVYPITEAVAEAFTKKNPDVVVTVSISGTGGGFKRFVVGETDINDASRRITPEEAEEARRNGVEWVEIPVAIDGLVIAVNKGNTWVDCLSIEELKRIWEPGSKVVKWSDVRDGWPEERIRLYGPGPDSGTFDYFTERVVGKAKASRTDYVASEDDNVLVAGVEAELYSLAYFGYAYYYQARDRIRAVPVNSGEGCVEPSYETIRTFKYPLSRPLFLYVNEERLKSKPELMAFIEFYLENAVELVSKVGYTPFPRTYYERALEKIRAGEYEGLLKLAIGG